MQQLKTKVINLDRRNDRWEQFNEKTKNFSILNIERFSAVDGKLLGDSLELQHLFRKNPYFPKKNPFNFHRHLNNGEKGAALSHFLIWKQIAVQSEPVLILEDDVFFSEHFETNLERLFLYVKENPSLQWDLLFLGHTDDVPIYNDDVIHQNQDFKLISINGQPSRSHGGGLFSYILTPDCAKKLLKIIETYGISQPLDWIIFDLFHTLTCFKVFPHFIFSIPFGMFNQDSDIQCH